MKDHPAIIELRRFNCMCCGYTASVYGEQYFDYGCYNFMATFECNQCQILFEDLVSKVEEWDTSDDFIYGLSEDIMCLRCNNNNSKVWNRATGKCPKCSGEMVCVIEGMQKLRHSE